MRDDLFGAAMTFHPFLEWFQTDANQSLYDPECPNLCWTELAPLGESGGAVESEIVSATERALQVAMVVDGGMNGDEFPQTSHAPEPLHGSLSSSEWQVRILRPIIHPAARFLPVGIAYTLQCRAVGPEFVGDQGIRASIALH